MKEIPEIDLHIYVVNKSLLGLNAIQEIERRIICDKLFAEKLEEIQEYYRNFQEINIDESVNTFKLIPLYLEPSESKKMTLAAQQISATDSKFKYIKTFISAENYVMIRMFHNPENKEYEFYAMCEDESLMKDIIIKIPSINIETKTNESGVAKVYAEYIPEDIELTVVLNK